MKLHHLVFVYIIALVISACNKGKNNQESCNGESTRRDIKLVTDTNAMEVDTIAITSTIDSLGSLNLIKVDSKTIRQDIEKKVFTVTAKVEKVKKYRDGDWKVKLVDENEKYLNCEAPNIGCSYAKTSRFYEKYQAVRIWIDENEDNLEGKVVTITGVAFIDINHGYPRNAAENEIELHPILDISF